MKTHWRLQISR